MGHGGWWGTQTANGRLMMIGWALGDYHGDAGPGINFLTRLTLLREVTFDTKTMNLVSNPVKELAGLRSGSLASEKGVALAANATHVVAGTGAGAAASADINITFSGITDGSAFGACVLANSAGEGLGIRITVAGGKASVAFGACSTAFSGALMDAGKGKGKTIDLFDETSINVRVTPDRSVADFFVAGGRMSGTVAWLAKTPRAAADSNVAVWASQAMSADIDVFGMGCGWATPSYTENPTM